MLALLAASLVAGNPILVKRAAPKGIDVSNHQGVVNFKTAKSNGISFAYIKATEGTSMGYLFPRRNILLTVTKTCSVHRSRLQWQLRWSHQCRPYSRRISFRTSGLVFRCYASEIFPCSRRYVLYASRWNTHPTRMFYTGGWYSDGITLPGALDIECESLHRRSVEFR